MLNSNVIWPLPKVPVKNDRIIVASQGIRIWTAECRIAAFDKRLTLDCVDLPTIENLRHQPRVAFSLFNSDIGNSVQGSGIARIVENARGEGPSIELEPYRLKAGQGPTFELQLAGWSTVKEGPPVKISAFVFWYQAFRAVTLPMSALPVLVGASAAFFFGQFNWVYLLLALLGTVLAHAGANATADYFDFKKGVDLAGALSSHLGALAREKVEPERVLLAAFACFLITAFIGFVLVALAGWQLLIFGLAGIMGAFFYTGRPISYKYRALGELMLGTLLGPVIVMGSYYLNTQAWNWLVFLISVALGMFVSSVSLVNNLRDLPDDRAAGIRTFPMSLGISGTKYLYYFLTACPYFIVAIIIILNHDLWPLVLVLISLPQAIRTIGALRATSDDIDDIRQNSRKYPYPLFSIRLYNNFAALTAIGIAIAGFIS